MGFFLASFSDFSRTVGNLNTFHDFSRCKYFQGFSKTGETLTREMNIIHYVYLPYQLKYKGADTNDLPLYSITAVKHNANSQFVKIVFRLSHILKEYIKGKLYKKCLFTHIQN